MSNTNINKLILGTVQFGISYGINNTKGKPTQEEVNTLLFHAYNSGIRCLDTAEAYGDAHNIIGNFHASNPDKIFDIITKFPNDLGDNLFLKVEQYFQQLKVTTIHGMLFHSFDTYKSHQDQFHVLSELKAAKKIEFIGVSVYTNSQLYDVLNDKLVDIIQLPFNLLDNENLRGSAIKMAKEKGKTIHTRSAFLQGLFFMPHASEHSIVKALIKQLVRLSAISNDNDMNLQRMALNYVLSQKNIDNVLIGVDDLPQLQENIKYASAAIPSSIIEEINKIIVEDTDLLNPSLWKQEKRY